MRDLYGGVSEQAKAGKHRYEDAKVLFASSRWRGAMYLAGYAVECLLKASLMKRLNVSNLSDLEEELQRRRLISPDSSAFTHHLESLLRWTGAFARLKLNPRMWLRFRIVNRWMPSWRYSSHPSSKVEAKEFLDSVRVTLDWIEKNV